MVIFQQKTEQCKIFVLFFLQSSTSSTTLPPGGVAWDWRAILNSADLHAGSSEGTNGGLTAWSRRLLLGATSRSNLDVESGDAELFAPRSNVLSGFDLHTTGDTSDGLLSGEIGDMNEGIVVTGVKVAHAKNVFSVGDLRSELDDLFLLDNLLLWGHVSF